MSGSRCLNRERCTTYIDGVVLAGDVGHFTHRAIHRRMESMVVLTSMMSSKHETLRMITNLRGKTENAQGSTVVSRSFVSVGGPKELGNREVSTLYPQLGCLLHGIECHHPTIGTTDKDSRIVEGCNRSCLGFQFPNKHDVSFRSLMKPI